MNKIPVVLIDKDEKKIDLLLNFLDAFPEIGKTRYSNDLSDLEIILSKKEPAVVLIGPTYGFASFEEILGNYNNALSKIRIVLLSDEISAQLLQHAIKMNIHDVLEYPLQEKDFKESLDRASNIFENKEDLQNKKNHESKKVMFFGTKGGSGNTFLTINFAIALKKMTKNEVAIYDMNYQFGDVALMMNIYPKNTIFDLVSLNKYDDESLDIFLIRHNSGVRILPSPIDPSQGESIDSNITNKVLEGLGRINNYVIVDAPFSFSNTVISIIKKIDHIFITATKEVPSIKNLKICLQLLERLNYPREKTSVILNMSDSKVEFEIDEIEKTIQRKIDIKIPNDKIVPISINKGTPAVISTPKSNVSKNIFKMLEILKPVEEIKKSGNIFNTTYLS